MPGADPRKRPGAAVDNPPVIVKGDDGGIIARGHTSMMLSFESYTSCQDWYQKCEIPWWVGLTRMTPEKEQKILVSMKALSK
jgi:hypothetical protein